ncbi:hypothetical protein [Pseudotamlana carrageenivorans]|uniref:Transposase n=1 Tax=Pseudotamlana carrageenivorans TaxID=2069432 RepID=A0A2I7SKL8_9FLAO|nr:hypothetical protein [Tamlana carrageenivorans]AUS06466.1 hypothetical protein C1A40_13880 [Tamlana carrageenivorans]
MTRQERLHLRNEKVRALFNQYCKKHPQWRTDAIIEEIVKRVFLSPRTIEGILRGEGIYGLSPEPSQQQKLQL